MNGHNCPPTVYEAFDFSDWWLFRLLKGLFQYHKVAFSSTDPGFVTCIELYHVEETKFNILIKGVSINKGLKSPLPVTISYWKFASDMC
ncbi:hypothetical protein DPMN_054209 [Dreissena polymorpha]|uniref:Uncharacterized protein n=1 Tax=Dreissena polymorpha TaxID=45954 RepID=A0A9D4CQ40_DREPO|nr:hypothetical protein DPMN_054209 [Dreissena polymorpha]